MTTATARALGIHPGTDGAGVGRRYDLWEGNDHAEPISFPRR